MIGLCKNYLYKTSTPQRYWIQAERVSAVSCFAFIAAYQNGLTTETLCLESVKSPTLIVITCLREVYRVKRILKKTSSWYKMRRFTEFITAVCVLILYWFSCIQTKSLWLLIQNIGWRKTPQPWSFLQNRKSQMMWNRALHVPGVQMVECGAQ